MGRGGRGVAAGDRRVPFLHSGAMACGPLSGALSSGFEWRFDVLLDPVYLRKDLAPKNDSRLWRRPARPGHRESELRGNGDGVGSAIRLVPIHRSYPGCRGMDKSLVTASVDQFVQMDCDGKVLGNAQPHRVYI